MSNLEVPRKGISSIYNPMESKEKAIQILKELGFGESEVESIYDSNEVWLETKEFVCHPSMEDEIVITPLRNKESSLEHLFEYYKSVINLEIQGIPKKFTLRIAENDSYFGYYTTEE